MTDDTRMEDLGKLFFRIWKLQKPGLVLSLHGSVPLGKAFQRRCYGLIFGVFQKTRMFSLPKTRLLILIDRLSMKLSNFLSFIA